VNGGASGATPTANRGNGGQAGNGQGGIGSNGSNGVVIIRYPGDQAATGGTITQSGGYTIHTFTANGTFAF
jgi:hypothetical protein